jgi:hypothetical protein
MGNVYTRPNTLYLKQVNAEEKLCKKILKNKQVSITYTRALQIVKLAEEYHARYSNVSISEILAICHTESRFNNTQVGSSGELGVMQVLPSTAHIISKELKVSYYNLQDLRTSIWFGTYFIHKLKRDYGKYCYIVYNQGFSKPLNNYTYMVHRNSYTSYLSVIMRGVKYFKV